MTSGTLFVDLGIDATNEDILNQMRIAKRCREEQEYGHVLCCVRGFHDDPRGLWAIPEVRAFCRRLWNLGFASYLDAFGRDYFRDTTKEPSALGAFEVWMMAEGEMRSEFLFSKELCDQFWDELKQCNAKADDAIGPMKEPS